MSQLDEILAYNQEFVNNKQYSPYVADKYPRKKMVIVTCMDTRLVELLPQALNIKNGDVKMVKTAGALISNPYGSVMRSVLVAVSLLKAEEVLVIGHLECGMIGLQPQAVLNALDQKGVSPEEAEQLEEQGINVEKWLKGCTTVEEGVIESVHLIRNHPLFPSHIPVHGLTIDPKTGKLELLIDGREAVTLSQEVSQDKEV